MGCGLILVGGWGRNDLSGWMGGKWIDLGRGMGGKWIELIWVGGWEGSGLIWVVGGGRIELCV